MRAISRCRTGYERLPVSLNVNFELNWKRLGYCMGRQFGPRSTDFAYEIFQQFRDYQHKNGNQESRCSQTRHDTKKDDDHTEPVVQHNLSPDEIEPSEDLFEGSIRRIAEDEFNRNINAREACLKHHGFRCHICDFNFADTYGTAMAGLIHVHHLIPLSQIREHHKIDPINDLRPVCPNCHYIIHSKRDCFAVDAVKAMLYQYQDTRRE
jgi:predicted HNH restriction endonuclease